MSKFKARYFLFGAILCSVISFTLGEGYFSFIIGMIGVICYFILLIMAFNFISRGKISTDKKIICPYCKGQSREYRNIVIKILYPLLFLTPKYICIECKKLFNTPYQEKNKFNIKKIINIR